MLLSYQSQSITERGDESGSKNESVHGQMMSKIVSDSALLRSRAKNTVEPSTSPSNPDSVTKEVLEELRFNRVVLGK